MVTLSRKSEQTGLLRLCFFETSGAVSGPIGQANSNTAEPHRQARLVTCSWSSWRGGSFPLSGFCLWRSREGGGSLRRQKKAPFASHQRAAHKLLSHVFYRACCCAVLTVLSVYGGDLCETFKRVTSANLSCALGGVGLWSKRATKVCLSAIQSLRSRFGRSWNRFDLKEV